jgi:hypothetical protein
MDWPDDMKRKVRRLTICPTSMCEMSQKMLKILVEQMGIVPKF